MRFLKTVGLVLLVAFTIHLLFAVMYVLADYNKALGENFGRAVLLMIAPL
jgi:succinate dehydrogenase hydrophobic anchor subunit